MAFSGSSASTDTVAEILRQPGRLVVGPTDVTAAFPHGGTSLGRFRGGISMTTEPVVIPLSSPDNTGPEPYDYHYAGVRDITIRVVLEQLGADTVQMAFPGMTAATTEGRKIQFPGGLVGGLLDGNETVKILYVPDDQDTNRCVLLRNCVPFIEPRLNQLHWGESPTQFHVWFRALRDTSAAAAEQRAVVDKLADITL